MNFEFKPAMVIVTEGNQKSIISNLIKLATGSWWTHVVLVVDKDTIIESKFPRVASSSLHERLDQLKREGRDYIVLDYPDITDDEREKVVAAAMTFNRRIYDVWNALFYFFFRVWVEGGRRVVCSSFISRAFSNAGKKLFGTLFSKTPPNSGTLIDNLEDDYCTPEEIVLYSDLQWIFRIRQ